MKKDERKIIITPTNFQIIGSIGAEELTDALLQTLLSAYNQVCAAVPADKLDLVRTNLYDMFNWKASTLLQTFIPDKDLRPDLTEEAILRASREIMQEHVDAIEKA